MRQKKREKSLLLVDPRHQINSFTFKRKKIYIYNSAAPRYINDIKKE